MSDLTQGLKKELEFLSDAQQMNYTHIANATPAQDMQEHWDRALIIDDRQCKIDIKSAKAIQRYVRWANGDVRRPPQFEHLIVEVTAAHPSSEGVVRKPTAFAVPPTGWLFGKADLFAFELRSDWLLVPKTELQRIVQPIIEKKPYISTFINEQGDQARYKGYSRSGRGDCMTMIRVADLDPSVCTRIPKAPTNAMLQAKWDMFQDIVKYTEWKPIQTTETGNDSLFERLIRNGWQADADAHWDFVLQRNGEEKRFLLKPRWPEAQTLDAYCWCKFDPIPAQETEEQASKRHRSARFYGELSDVVVFQLERSNTYHLVKTDDIISELEERKLIQQGEPIYWLMRMGELETITSQKFIRP